MVNLKVLVMYARSLEFTQATSSSDVPWLATIDLATQFHIATGGEISVSLSTGIGYSLGTTDSAIVTITDVKNDEVPTVAVLFKNDTTEIPEGTAIEVEITATDDYPPTEINPITVFIDVRQTVGDYIAFRVPRSIVLTSVSESFTISTIDDSLKKEMVRSWLKFPDKIHCLILIQ